MRPKMCSDELLEKDLNRPCLMFIIHIYIYSLYLPFSQIIYLIPSLYGGVSKDRAERHDFW